MESEIDQILIPSTENANDSLKGRVLEVSLADLQNDPEQGFRKIKLRVEDVAVSPTPRPTSPW